MNAGCLYSCACEYSILLLSKRENFKMSNFNIKCRGSLFTTLITILLSGNSYLIKLVFETIKMLDTSKPMKLPITYYILRLDCTLINDYTFILEIKCGSPICSLS